MVHADPDARLREMLAPGNLFEEKYEIVSELGTGSFAIVAKARHQVMGRDVALKCLKPSVVRSNPEVSERFVNEVQIVSRLRHPNTVTIFDFGQTADVAFMVLEYLEGKTLDEVIAAEGALEQTRATHLCRQILKSLAEAHALGIVHRDLKPSNIMLTELHGEPDFVKVLDFGVAKLLDDADRRDTKMQPRSTQFIGTPVYMSPEQVLGKPVRPASDLYSLGLILYEMLTGENPIEHESVAAVVREHLDEETLPFSALRTLPEPIQQVILRSTQRQPKKRYRTVEEFAHALPMEGGAESIERIRPRVQQMGVAATLPGLAEETSEPDVFSGKNYIGPFDPEDEPDEPLAAEFIAPSPKKPKKRRPKRDNKPAPSLRTDEMELDLDMEKVNRHKRRIERRRRHGGGRGVDGGWEAREYWTRGSVYAAGLVAGYWAFVLLSAMMTTQDSAVRLGGGALIVGAAVLWTNFSAVKKVGVDFGKRWLLPTARNLIYILIVVALAAAFLRPTQTAEGLGADPTWFYEALPQIPPLTWASALTAWMAAKMAGFFAFMAEVLPY